jgi:hypothetical protein
MIDILKNRLHQLRKSAALLPEEEQTLRFDICKSCEHFISLTTQCKKCGCVMKAKTYLPYAECPIGKWGKVEQEQKD